MKDTGIYKKNDKYYFYKNGIKVSDLSILERLNKYRVPPAWKSVWYASDKKSHIQVHGIRHNKLLTLLQVFGLRKFLHLQLISK